MRKMKEKILRMAVVAMLLLGHVQVTMAQAEATGLHHALKQKFIDGNAGFMSLVALALVLGLAFSIERIIYLTLAEIDTRKFTGELSTLVGEGKLDEAKSLCQGTRGPVAALWNQGLLRA